MSCVLKIISSSTFVSLHCHFKVDQSSKNQTKQNVVTSKVLLKNVTVLIDFGANCNRLQTLDSEYEQLSESCMQSCNIENPVI